LGRGKPRLRSEAKENVEGAGIPCHKDLKKKKEIASGWARGGHHVIKYE
jgi:hypothetical protein